MNEIYRSLGVSKQAFHQRLDLQIRQQEELAQFLPIISQVRADHPRMSSRVMYQLIKPQTIGRDRFEAFCFEHGYKLDIKRNFHRTTNSLGVTRFENLKDGFELKGINQIWVSDITYYEMLGMFYYLTFIMDLYSRRILGYSLSNNLFTENTTIPALNMAIRKRAGTNIEGLIFHSDGGGQYYCKEFLKLTKEAGIRNSMCESVYGNTHAERINGTIKNAYLEGYNPQTTEQLNNMLIKAVKMYNEQKPHEALKGLSPAVFEDMLTGLLTELDVINKRKKVTKKENLIIINNFA
jgi:transposase InsO family protein